MTNAITEAVRLALLAENDGGDDLDFGIVIVTTSTRLGWRGTIEVDGRAALPPETVSFMRDRLINEERETAVNRYRVTFGDGSTLEGPFGLETFSSKGERFEVVLTAAGDQTSTGERDPAEVARQTEARVMALGEGATDAVIQVTSTLIQNRPPEVPLDDALSAVLAGGLTGLVMTMLAADPTATPDEVEKALLEGVSAIMGAVRNGR